MCEGLSLPKCEELFKPAWLPLNNGLNDWGRVGFTTSSLGATQQLSCKLQFLLPLRSIQKMLFHTLSLVARQFVPDVLVRKLIDDRVKLLTKRRIGQQTKLNSLLLCLVQLTEQISPNEVFTVYNYDGCSFDSAR